MSTSAHQQVEFGRALGDLAEVMRGTMTACRLKAVSVTADAGSSWLGEMTILCSRFAKLFVWGVRWGRMSVLRTWQKCKIVSIVEHGSLPMARSCFDTGMPRHCSALG